MAKVTIEYKDGKKEILENVDDIDIDRDDIDIYFSMPARNINKKDVKKMFVEYEHFGNKMQERIV